jgi:hypothetical protein
MSREIPSQLRNRWLCYMCTVQNRENTEFSRKFATEKYVYNVLFAEGC